MPDSAMIDQSDGYGNPLIIPELVKFLWLYIIVYTDQGVISHEVVTIGPLSAKDVGTGVPKFQNLVKIMVFRWFFALEGDQS